jgi:methyl-accepting chemotaxis protein
VKLNNLKIAPRLGIAVEVSLFGLCVAGALALYVVKEAMFDARVERLHAIVDRAGNIQSGTLRGAVDGFLAKVRAA